MTLTITNLDNKAIQDKLEWVINNDGVTWFNMGQLNDGRQLCLVFGWTEGYDKDENLIQKTVDHGGSYTYTLCAKLAVNIDDLQCDYDVDWYMPSDNDGNIWDTDQAVTKNEDFTWYIDESKLILKALNSGVLKV